MAAAKKTTRATGTKASTKKRPGPESAAPKPKTPVRKRTTKKPPVRKTVDQKRIAELEAKLAQLEEDSRPTDPEGVKVPERELVEQPKTDPTKPERYVARNLTGYSFGLRLERQHGEGKRRFDLKPRGQRGDFAPLQDGDLEDLYLQDAVGRGAIEIITQTEAAKVAQKQTTNQQRVHPALALLRNELGEEYEEGAFSVAQSFEDQGVVVAELHDGQIAVDRSGIVRPGNEPIPERANRLRRPGERPSNSPMVSQSQVRPSDQTAASTDAKARKRGLGGPSAGVPDGVKVTVAPTQHT